MAAVTNCHNLSISKQHRCINLTALEVRSLKWVSLGQCQDVCKDSVPPEALGENMFPCLFQFPKAAYIPWLMVHSIFKPAKAALGFLTSHHTSTAAAITSPSLILILLPLSLTSQTDPYNYIGPTWIVSPSQIFYLSHICKVPLAMLCNIVIGLSLIHI